MPKVAHKRGPTQKASKRMEDIMTRQVEVIHPDASLEDAARIMKTYAVGAVPVSENGRPVGIITDRDIVLRGVAEGLDAKTVKVGDVMTQGIEYCSEDDPLLDGARKMMERQIRRLAILNHDKQLVGIVSLGDLAMHVDDDRLSGKALESISEPDKT